MISKNFCLITAVRFFRACQKSEFESEIRNHNSISVITTGFDKKAENPWKQRLSALLAGVAKGTWTPDPTLRSMAYRFVRRFEPCCLMLNFQRNSDIIYRHISCVIPWSTVWVSMVLGRPISKFLANNESHIMDRYSCCTELQCLDRERGLVLYSTCKWFLCLAHTLF